MSDESGRWDQITSAAAADHGLVARDDLRTAGITKAMLERWVRTGRLERVHPRVWRVSGTPITWHHQLRAGLLSLGPEAAVGHEAAAQVHGFDRSPSDRVEFVVPRSLRRRVLPGAAVRSTRVIDRIDRVRVGGVDVTSATRTVIDLAGIGVADRRLDAAIDSAVASGASSPEAIERRLASLRCRGRRGVVRLERALEHSGGHSMLERRFLEVIAAAGLPRPETQVWFRTGGRSIGRVDFWYRAEGVVIEVAGRRGHATASDRARDAQRRNELQALGLEVLEFTWADVTRRPGYVVATVRHALDQRRRSGLVSADW